MAEQAAKISGLERAAIFLMSLGENAAAEVLRQMEPREVQQVGAAMANLSKVTQHQMKLVVKEFSESVRDETAVGIGARDYVRTVLDRALGDKKARGLMNRILLGRKARGIESLKWVDAKGIAGMIKSEHPQIIAIVLSHLDSDHAAAVLKHIDKEQAVDVVMRIARLETVHPAALKELDDIIERQTTEGEVVEDAPLDGLKTAADILNHLDNGMDAELLDRIGASDQAMSEKIRDKLFIFDNLVNIDNRGIQRLLRDIPPETLVIALKGADESIRRLVFNNMSSRASDMLRDDIESRGPIKISEVEQAQKEILVQVNTLAEAGEIHIGGRGGEQYV